MKQRIGICMATMRKRTLLERLYSDGCSYLPSWHPFFHYIPCSICYSSEEVIQYATFDWDSKAGSTWRIKELLSKRILSLRVQKSNLKLRTWQCQDSGQTFVRWWERKAVDLPKAMEFYEETSFSLTEQQYKVQWTEHSGRPEMHLYRRVKQGILQTLQQTTFESKRETHICLQSKKIFGIPTQLCIFHLFDTYIAEQWRLFSGLRHRTVACWRSTKNKTVWKTTPALCVVSK